MSESFWQVVIPQLLYIGAIVIMRYWAMRTMPFGSAVLTLCSSWIGILVLLSIPLSILELGSASALVRWVYVGAISAALVAAWMLPPYLAHRHNVRAVLRASVLEVEESD